MESRIPITNSEWVVLRVILNHGPMGSGEIAESLKREQGWSVTTVKTFLSRLVTKKAVAFTVEKNAYRYHPLITEMEYVRNETNTFLDNLYGGAVRLETEHFRFSGSGSLGFIQRIADSLEGNFERIARDFSYVQKRKQNVFVHSSLQLLHSALGLDKGPDWMTAGWSWDIVHLAPEVAFSHSSPEYAALHVYSQLLLRRLNPNAPFWLVQGISAYEADWLTFEAVQKAIGREADSLDAFTVYRLPTDLSVFEKQGGFEITSSVIGFIVDVYGNDSLIRFLKSPENLRTIFHCTEPEFWNAWIAFVKGRYLR